MLSITRLETAGFTRLVPVETVIVDEASQIELGGYLTILARFGRNIKKLVFIGDDKQRKSLRKLQNSVERLLVLTYRASPIAQWHLMVKKTWAAAWLAAYLNRSICVGMPFSSIPSVRHVSICKWLGSHPGSFPVQTACHNPSGSSFRNTSTAGC